MKRFDIVRALKDRDYRNGLTGEQSELLGANPAGVFELDESLLSAVGGASTPENNGSNCGGGSGGSGAPTLWSACRQ